MSLWSGDDYVTKTSESWVRVKVQIVNFTMDWEEDLVYYILAVMIDFVDGFQGKLFIIDTN